MYSAKLITPEDYENFEIIYDDFCSKAKIEYNFELEPIDYDGFLDSVERGFIECIVLYDNHQLVGFLVYTTAISEAIELNIIHCTEQENYLEHARELLLKFLELTRQIRKQKIVCYPMLGNQKTLIGTVVREGFQFVGIEVLRFKMNGTESKELFSRARMVELPPNYRVTRWDNRYFDDAVRVIQESFKDSSDALFDPRFRTIAGCSDIISKVVNDVYAKFLPEATSVLLYNEQPVGFSFMNITNNSIVNIPLVGVTEAHQGKGLSTLMLKRSMDEILNNRVMSNVTEINTTTETNNLQALRLYKNLGFLEDYSYPQAYLPISNLK
ncbi:GNAT family N-acetyltransferase [bacterium]|nr:GNAT family N-acetyltransferase [bacterium]